jgi:hypothetical protein
MSARASPIRAPSLSDLAKRMVVLDAPCFRLASKQARIEGLSLSEYLSKAVKTDLAVVGINREKIG